MLQKILAWTCFGCAVLFAALSLTAVLAGESSGIGIAPLLYTGIAVAVIAILLAIALVAIGHFE